MREINISSNKSETVRARVPVEMFKALEIKARKKRISLSTLIRNVLDKYLNPEEEIEV